MAIDPICGMNVKEDSRAIVVKDNGSTHYFCSEHCKKTFLQRKSQKVVTATAHAKKHTMYTCPMHPEIKQDNPGDCRLKTGTH